MKSAKVVIGANYGDEGKGMVTDWLCSRSSIKPLVVRFNGGAQAGHTVITPEGQRHVFGHIGSGSFLGCPTHLSRFFISNPILLLSELNEFGRNIEISVDPESIVTTPYDMVINQIALLNEGVNTSCGVGINETVTRSDTINLQIKDLSDALEEKLLVIKEYYFPKRLKHLGITEVPDKFKIYLEDRSVIKKFLSICRKFLKEVKIVEDKNVKFNEVVFEGAQGLLLDQFMGDYPYVTRSYTGMSNVKQLCSDMDIDVKNIEIYYVSRMYLTRHGDGPLKNEYKLDDPAINHIIGMDQTNVHNQFQGSLRYAPLDFDQMFEYIEYDLPRFIMNRTSSKLVLTWYDANNFEHITNKVLLKNKFEKLNMDIILSTSKTREGFNV